MSNGLRTASSSLEIRSFRCLMDYTSKYVIDFPRMSHVPLYDHARRPTYGNGGTTLSDPDVIPSLHCGERIPDDFLGRFPKVLKAIPATPRAKKVGVAQDVLEFGCLVSPRFREFVEKIEPGRHQFIPVEIESVDGVVLEFFYFNCLNWVASDDLYCFTNIEAVSGVKLGETGKYNPVPGIKFWRIGPAARPPVRASAFNNAEIMVEGRKAWELHPKSAGSYRYFCRNRFFEEFPQSGLKGIGFSRPYELSNCV